MSTDETLLAALQARLAGAGIGASVERSRTIAFEREDLPGVVIKPKSEESVPFANALRSCTLSVSIEVHTRGDVPDQVAAPIASAIDAAIKEDPSFGGLAFRVLRSKDWDFSDSDGTGCELAATYQISYIEPA